MTDPESPPTVRQAPDVVAVGFLLRVSLLALGMFLLAVGIAGAWTSERSLMGAPAQDAVELPIAGVDRAPIAGTGAGSIAHARARAGLARWSWVDVDAGIARIPIKNAMELIAAGTRPEGAPPIDHTAPTPSEGEE